MSRSTPISWTCPFCNRVATVTKYDINDGTFILFDESKHGIVGISFESTRCPNTDCREVQLKILFNEHKKQPSGRHSLRRHIGTWALRPESNAKTQPDYIPKPIRDDYNEACLIVEKSPKASATLSRRCLQGMIRDFHKIQKGTLFAEINALENCVDSDTWHAITAVKDFGNIGAHMEKDINLIIPVNPDEAKLLIEMIEQLFEDWYIRRYQREQKMGLIVEKAKEKKELRAQKPEI